MLERLARETKTILCFGIDPDLKKIPNGTSADAIVPYYSELVDALLEERQIAALKPNYAYFAQYGFEGLHALKALMDRYRNKTLLIFDGKRGDIGKSSQAYAREMYDFWGADACTVSPYMGEDSVKSFLQKNKLPYLLCRTSNAGAKDLQEQKLAGGEVVYTTIAKKAMDWKCGLVVGATSGSIQEIVKITKNKTPLLIPGIGAQGGDLDMVLKAIQGNLPIHRINASSSLAFAHEKHSGKPAESTLKEAQKLNEKIRAYL
ncbi:MAG TPA: orotidine-5'-phosphate decarboxylase [Candidatus Bilamarchaeaceae archaeon]|nr:orotidine-5'-phosphate decarboxylase [Candidatus Bilamarchaeaceae archaeon]